MYLDLDLDLDYYDKILGGISISLIAGSCIGFLTNVPLPYGVGAGALVSLVLMYHGMFRHGPHR